jgi:outer membrane protein assembly factor BamB
MPHWGYSGSPLIVDGKLIVQPGGAEASIVALDPATGDVIWETPGRKAAYAGLIVARIHGTTQLIGCDEESFGGWDAANGRRLWKIVPEISGDFFAPTPVLLGQHLLLAGENNGARLHAFDAKGVLLPKSRAREEALAPDAHTPVFAGGRIIGLGGDFCCLDAPTLKPIWSVREPEMGTYASMISDGRARVLTLSEKGMLFLHDFTKVAPVELARVRVCPSSAHVLSHPALVGKRLYLRLAEEVVCLEL